SRRRHTRFSRDWSSDVCSSDLAVVRDDDQDVDVAADQGLDVAHLPGVVAVRRLYYHRGTQFPGLLDKRVAVALPPFLLERVEGEIGSASCRERVESSVVVGGLR